MDLNSIYKKIYPDRQLKDLQIEIINNLLLGKDVVAILATGYGKSICYQMPFLALNKSVIVVSPLIALMEDQQLSLEKVGIPSICMNSNMTQSQKEHEKKLILDCDEQKIIYITPESLIKSEIFIRDLVSNNKLCLIAIDEAHCISSWGHDFRKDYQQLCCLKEWTNDEIPFFACTATATVKVQKEIIMFLQLDKPKIVISSFDRKNLFLECKRKSDNIQKDIKPYLEQYKDDCIIIYAKTREITESICEMVNGLNISCEAYHAGLPSKERKKIHNKFVNKECNCIVATIAFGMGIDQNVHLIIHYGLPGDMESYVQEIGRAGRDGLESKCVLFWSDQDLHICRSMLKDISNEEFRKHKDKQIKIMDSWSRTNQCRKKIMLNHFGEILENPCMKCDNCISKFKELEKIYDQEPIRYPIFIILKTLFVVKRNGLSTGRIIDIIKGSKNKNSIQFTDCPTYGLGANYSIYLLKELIRLLIYNNYLREVSLENFKFGSILMTTENSINFYSLNKKYKKENDMGYIEWPNFDIPESFEILFSYLPKKNIPSEKINRKTLFEKLKDEFEFNNSDEEIITITETSNSDIKLPISDKLQVQSVIVNNTKETKEKKEKKSDTINNNTDNNIKISVIRPKINDNTINDNTIDIKPKKKSNKTKISSIPSNIIADLEI